MLRWVVSSFSTRTTLLQTRLWHLGQVSIDSSLFHPQLAQTQRYGSNTVTQYSVWRSSYAELLFFIAAGATPGEVGWMGAVSYK
jgi:hypothetical protein